MLWKVTECVGVRPSNPHHFGSVKDCSATECFSFWRRCLLRIALLREERFNCHVVWQLVCFSLGQPPLWSASLSDVLHCFLSKVWCTLFMRLLPPHCFFFPLHLLFLSDDVLNRAGCAVLLVIFILALWWWRCVCVCVVLWSCSFSTGLNSAGERSGTSGVTVLCVFSVIIRYCLLQQ